TPQIGKRFWLGIVGPQREGKCVPLHGFRRVRGDECKHWQNAMPTNEREGTVEREAAWHPEQAQLN
ncbi:MAG: hypothetical protein JO060_08225, partial [Candidatus Eremiobacteraeota bacterium]|nr:hypothetical protein [Candidatus Eremiobacteraeota bacterium]